MPSSVCQQIFFTGIASDTAVDTICRQHITHGICTFYGGLYYMTPDLRGRVPQIVMLNCVFAFLFDSIQNTHTVIADSG